MQRTRRSQGPPRGAVIRALAPHLEVVDSNSGMSLQPEFMPRKLANGWTGVM